ncbi:MAG TPA: DUF362 domain-containing protein [archaeon]|nr:DUF362 domain-containing protein [archaeon]
MSKIAVLKTSPETVVKDYARLMKLASSRKVLRKAYETVLKINLSWTKFYPACSTPPWQLEGVLKTLIDDGYEPKHLHPVENQTVVTHPWKGAYGNKWLPVLKKYGTPFEPLTDVEWIDYQPKAEMLAMDKLFPGISVPKMFLGTNVIHLPTVKTHGHTTTTGAMKNAFGGLIPKYRHHAHQKIHEVLVDLLAIQKEIHKGILAVMDGTVCGDGAGPRTMVPYEGNIILASDDQVAIDAFAADIMGFDPMSIPYLKMAHDRGLGTADIKQMEIVGMDRKEALALNFGFKTRKSVVIRWDQRLRKGTAGIPWLHRWLFHSPIFRTFIFASGFFHDQLWYPTIGQKHIRTFNQMGWGPLFTQYPYGRYPKFTDVKEWDPY